MKEWMLAILLPLGSNSYTERERAEQNLADRYPVTIPAIVYGLGSADPEVKRRCERVFRAKLHRDYWRAVALYYVSREYDLEYDKDDATFEQWDHADRIALLHALAEWFDQPLIYEWSATYSNNTGWMIVAEINSMRQRVRYHGKF